MTCRVLLSQLQSLLLQRNPQDLFNLIIICQKGEDQPESVNWYFGFLYSFSHYLTAKTSCGISSPGSQLLIVDYLQHVVWCTLLGMPAVHAVPAQLLTEQFVRYVTQLPQAPILVRAAVCKQAQLKISTTFFMYSMCSPSETLAASEGGTLCPLYPDNSR